MPFTRPVIAASDVDTNEGRHEQQRGTEIEWGLDAGKFIKQSADDRARDAGNA